MKGNTGKECGVASASGTNWKAEEAIVGNAEALQRLRECISYPLLYSREARKLGLKWPCGLILYGPPGTGKTSLVRAIVRECDAHLIVISTTSVQRSHAGETEKILRDAFSEAESHAKLGMPSVIFIDEIDTLCHKRDSRREQDVRITSQISVLMDFNKLRAESGCHVVVIASTNRVDSIDPALRRAGRFDAEIEVSIPNKAERLQIFKHYTKKFHLDPNVNLEAIAASCKGYVGADIEGLCRQALLSASKKSPGGYQDASDCIVTEDDWNYARSIVGPSITRGVTNEIPNVSWDDIGGLKDLKKKIRQAVEWPLKYPEAFARLRISPVRGVLLHGPPGCSKTILAKAAAHQAQASFFSLICADLYSMYVGEGEALLRDTFKKARLAAPSIVFFDEFDSVAVKRGESSDMSSTVSEKLLSTLLTEMDGIEQAKGILVLAATNRPYAIDAALMRPGRFDLVLYVPPPDIEGRYEILRVHTRGMHLDADVDLWKIAAKTELFTGAELRLICEEAGLVAFREDMKSSIVSNRHFEPVLRSVRPALTVKEIESYALFGKNRFLKKKSVSSEVIKQICKLCFSTPWVVFSVVLCYVFSSYVFHIK